jgi:ribonuclease BN (tRNA processing enzyme)
MQGFANFVFTRGVQERQFGKAPPLKVLASKVNINSCQELLRIFYPDRKFELDWHEVDQGEEITLGKDHRVNFIRNDHTVESMGLSLHSGSNKLVCYTSDTAMNNDLIDFCQNSSALIGECFGTNADFGDILKAQKHLSAEDVSRLAALSNVKLLVIFHMHSPYKDPTKRASLLEIISRNFHGHIVFPKENEAVEVG